MYDSEFLCTYKMMDNEEDQEQLYKIQLLQAFGLDNWDDKIINDSMLELFNLMKVDNNLEKILLRISKVESLQHIISMSNEYIDREYANASANDDSDSDKNLVLFSLLFQYEHFDLFHRCIYDFIHYSHISDKNMDTLLETIL